MSINFPLVSSLGAVLVSTAANDALPQDDGTNGMSIAFASHSRPLHVAVANEVLNPGWNAGTTEQICDRLAQAKRVVSSQLKESAWDQEFNKLKLDMQGALSKTFLIKPHEERMKHRDGLKAALTQLADHMKAGPDKYVGDFAPFMPDKESCMAAYKPSSPDDLIPA
ncbi:hypothetical protein CAL26_12450 [Bordetella genomosp. 9]|uniref:Uncharacterized protein n=1 Tax=Bordetella genomosp. 9 TaxID=1416803 RepID=A0A261R1C1_9BORD|nr:hypothetical protein [Bordetella genomosp. 9]OZI18527.1 hypothetical protein CAL26_12450 [Bordetella genomosp. 9]